MDWTTLPLPANAPDPTAWGRTLAEWRASQPAPPLVGKPRGARRAGCSRRTLAQALGVSWQLVKAWETGALSLSPEMRERVRMLRESGPEAVKRLARKELQKKFG